MSRNKARKSQISIETIRQEVKFFCKVGGKYSDLELSIIACQILGVYVRGDLYTGQLLRWVYAQVLKSKKSAPAKIKKKPAASESFYSSRAWKILRYKALELHGNNCQCCGASPKDGAKIHVDHIKPKSTHPELSLDLRNLQILCADCNIGKINQFQTDWRESMSIDDRLDMDAIIGMPEHLRC